MSAFRAYRVSEMAKRFGVFASRRSPTKIFGALQSLALQGPIPNRSVASVCAHQKDATILALRRRARLHGITAAKSLSSTVEGSQGDEGEAIVAEPVPDTLGMRLLKHVGWLGGFYSKNSVLMRSAMKMYECCVEDIDFEDFYIACGMPDTFQSWFLVNQLHIWMCLVRLKQEGKNGQYMYRKLVSLMWQDVEARMKAMGEIDSTVVRESLHELVQEFYGLIFAYDEGLLSHDRVLAAALWRNMFHSNRTDAVEMANVVEYVRRQVQHLDSLDSEQLLATGHVTWLSFKKPKEQEPFLYHAY